MRIWGLLLIAVALAACSTSAPVASRTQPPSTPSESTPAPRSPAGTASGSPASSPAAHAGASYAVVVNEFQEGGPTYSISLVAADGRVVASATPRKRSSFVQIGNLSTSLTTLYYLDGDADIHYLRPDGSTGLATTVNLEAHHVAAFAVSPDDHRIAVSVLDFTRYPVGTRLYVEDLAGHANHVELFASATVEEWPAGWHAGHLVMAMGLNVPPQNQYEGFLRGHGYHVADAQTGQRLLSLCDGGDSYLAESPAGFVCIQFPQASLITWNGASRPVPTQEGCSLYGPLSPTGVMASDIVSINGGCGATSVTRFWDAAGVVSDKAWNPAGTPYGWTDANHLVTVGEPPAGGPATSTPVYILDVRNGDVAQAQATGFFAAALPGGL